MKKSILLSLFISLSAYSADEYVIEVAHDDQFFIINGSKFEAKTYCFSMHEGDHVIFIKGSPLGVCTSAEIYNLNSKKSCRLWCE